ncbi:hypothetical protein [Nesterenkonia rhizosphaerae]|uniref:Uncharacterized protein n=1 Tax=Nesterenkonia rhizosphaerae TaxID=1348272 RepID=A0ABP9FUW7_9MICC
MSVSTNAALTVVADAVGAVSVGLGGFLAIAPLTGGRRLGLEETTLEGRRILGTADLALGIAIIAGRSSPQRWRTVAARSLLHLVFAREYMRNIRKRHAVGMCALFAVDAGIALGLRKEQRSA